LSERQDGIAHNPEHGYYLTQNFAAY